MLLLQKRSEAFPVGADELLEASATRKVEMPAVVRDQFLPTSAKIVQFTTVREPEPSDRIVYMCGAFDMFHVGHVAAIKAARALGDYLIVGIHTDDAIAQYRTPCVCNIHERTLGVLQCRYVDEVVIGAPYEVTEKLMEHMNVATVVHGSTDVIFGTSGTNPYAAAISQGKFSTVESKSTVTASVIIDRIMANRRRYEERNAAKLRKEAASAAAMAAKGV